MPMLEGQIDAVIGVDTHRDTHAATDEIVAPATRCSGCCSTGQI
jgi:hypothetical protein